MNKIYESPDKGKTIYERNVEDYDNKKTIKKNGKRFKLQYTPKVKVICPTCKTLFNEDAVEFVNIEEDIQGRDLLTFVCPVCKESKKSYRLG